MNRRFWNAYNRAQDNIVLGSTTLKLKIVLMYQGQSLECASCDTVAEVKAWARAKQNEWSAIGKTVSFRME